MSTLCKTDALVHHAVRQHCVLSCLQMSSSVFNIVRLFFLHVIDILLTPPRLSCCGLDSPRWEGLWENCTTLIVAACGGVKMEMYWWQAGVVMARSSVSWGREGNYCWSCCIFFHLAALHVVVCGIGSVLEVSEGSLQTCWHGTPWV